MKIRSITYFFKTQLPLENRQWLAAEAFLIRARPAFLSAGYEVQTARMATPPFPTWFPWQDLSTANRLVQELETATHSAGYDYLSLGPALPQELGSFDKIPELLAATQDVFYSGLMTTSQSAVSLLAVQACAGVIQRVANLSPDGFANLRFAALANVAPGSPFFPAAYHTDQPPAFALATEAADLAVEAFSTASDLQEARTKLIATIENHATTIMAVSRQLEIDTGALFSGIDFSLAPFPEENASLGTALERLGVPAVGLHGSLAVSAFLADAIDQARFRRAGFNGLMLPVLEDATLAKRAAEGTLTVKDLLLYSAVCGTGLDTLPLPGDVSRGALAALLLDLAALSLRLNKPLTARLMPIPDKAVGDPTGFDFPYFANSRVLALDARPLQGSLSGNQVLSIYGRSKYPA